MIELSVEELKALRDEEARRGHAFNVEVLEEVIKDKEGRNASHNMQSKS